MVCREGNVSFVVFKSATTYLLCGAEDMRAVVLEISEKVNDTYHLLESNRESNVLCLYCAEGSD